MLAAGLAASGELKTGVRLYSAACRNREARGEKTPWVLVRLREQTHGPLEQALTLPEFALEAEEGRHLNLRQATAIALRAAEQGGS